MSLKKYSQFFINLVIIGFTTLSYAQFGGGGSYTITPSSNSHVVGQTTVFTVSGPNILGAQNWSSSGGNVSTTTGLSTTVTWTSSGAALVSVTVADNMFNYHNVSLFVTVTQALNSGSITGAQTLCYGGNPGTLSNSASASGGSGSYSYQWQYSNNGSSGWSSIGGATSTSYNPPGGLTASRWYRRRVISGGVTKYTNSVKVTVYSNLVAGSI
ncbi:hypothetical protein, partial [uncultured Croceitalea sp.]|uniref:hypothetical protein n=1 Tax=uncultured Croceitalea sp. TaxID=1798908 RepID=UPI0033060C1C